MVVEGKIKRLWRELEGIDKVSKEGEARGSDGEVIDDTRYVWFSMLSKTESGLPVEVSHESSMFL